MDKKYYSLAQVGKTATISIYGDITSWPWLESDVSAYNLSKQLNELENVTQIDVFINSYGGEVAEGLAIYNALKRHKAQVTTYCDGFACSIASVIFAAGNERVVYNTSLMLVHNAWSIAQGNAEELRKQAADLEIITTASIEAYKAVAVITEEEIKALMDAESWITPQDALKYGFATQIAEEAQSKTSQNAKQKLFNLILQSVRKDEALLADLDNQSSDIEADVTDSPPESDVDLPPTPDIEPPTTKPEADYDATQNMSGFFNALLKL